jgi:TetR/AcrR family transcriptional repressor of bet genes
MAVLAKRRDRDVEPELGSQYKAKDDQLSKSNTNANRKSRTASKEVRRRQLIDATIASIAKHGFSGTTLAAVTKGAKLSHGIVNFHFKSKEALFVETLGFLAKEHYDCWHEAMEEAGPDPAAQLAAIIEVDFERSISSPKKLAVWFAFWGQPKYRSVYLKIHDTYDKRRTDEISRLCGQMVEDGGYEGIDPILAARILVSLIDGLWLSLLLYPKSAQPTRARSDCFTLLSQLFPKHFPVEDNICAPRKMPPCSPSSMDKNAQ